MGTVEKTYHCVECGHQAPELYKKFPGGVIKVSNCKACDCVVDKYIEFDPIIVMLDAILHKIPAYRHVLWNTQQQWVWKLLLILLFCDAYHKWETSHQEQAPDTLINVAIQLRFYIMLLKAAAEWLVMLLVLWFLLLCCSRLKWIQEDRVPLLLLLQCLSISSFGKLLVVPASIWGQSQSRACWLLIHFFIYTSNNAALKALYIIPQSLSPWILGIAHLCQLAVDYSIS